MVDTAIFTIIVSSFKILPNVKFKSSLHADANTKNKKYDLPEGEYLNFKMMYSFIVTGSCFYFG